MRTRAFVHVAGPAKAGKTALVEAMLECSDALVIAARCGRDDTLAHPRESSPAHAPRASPLPAGGGQRCRSV